MHFGKESVWTMKRTVGCLKYQKCSIGSHIKQHLPTPIVDLGRKATKSKNPIHKEIIK
jgi:hypothetical protein